MDLLQWRENRFREIVFYHINTTAQVFCGRSGGEHSGPWSPGEPGGHVICWWKDGEQREGNFRRRGAQWERRDGVQRARGGLACSDGSLITEFMQCFLSGVLLRNTLFPGKPTSAHHEASALPATPYPPHQYFSAIIECSTFWTLFLNYHTTHRLQK